MTKSLPSARVPRVRQALIACALACACISSLHATPGAPVLSDGLTQQIHQFIAEALKATYASRTHFSLGPLDSRLRLAPCQFVQPYLPQGVRLWGKTRIGLRCIKGPTQWRIYLPVTINVFGPALVAATALPAGHVLTPSDLREADVNLSDSPPSALSEKTSLLGLRLARPVSSGQSLRQIDFKPRQWFAAGDTVQIRASGPGFGVVSSGEAVTAGLEGQTARVRTLNGRVVTGKPVGTRELEIRL